MRAVLVHVREEDLADRRSKGLDRWDEMWEGVLHMTPAPSLEHQRIVDEILVFLHLHVARKGRGTIRSGINVFNEAEGRLDYRIPDLTFVAAGRERVLHADGARGEGPDAVIEVRSPNDETYEKLPFYAAIGTFEIIVIDRDTKRPEIFRLAGSQVVTLQPDGEGWLRSETMRVRLKAIDAQPPRLRLEDVGDASIAVDI